MDQGLANYSLQVESGSLPVFVNKFYWTTDLCIHLHMVCGCFWSVRAEMSSCDRDLVAHKGEDI